MIGKHLSHYLIESELGRGGMGIVYRARDTKLDRTVAIKVLPSAALASSDDRARFYREAKAAAALTHPHIAIIHGVDEAVPEGAPHGTEPSPFIAMEFIDGVTLEEQIARAPLKITDALRTASEVANALKAAHAQHVVHRDIKSANVMIATDGSAKVLDFGLAQTAASTKLTQLGSTLGTVAYMSPEQAKGEEVDHRTDIWSLGVVVYEMVAGRLPFPGEYEQAILYEVLNQDPEPLTALRTGVPMELERIVNKCLSKDRADRYQHVDDLLVDLRGSQNMGDAQHVRVDGQSHSGARTESSSKSGLYIARTNLILSFLAAMLATAGLTWLVTSSGSRSDLPRVTSISRVTTESDLEMYPSLHPLGDRVVYSSGEVFDMRIYSRLSDGGNRIRLVPTWENDQQNPTYSQDGSLVLFESEGSIYTVEAMGGVPRPVILRTSPSRTFLYPTWSPDNSAVAFTDLDSIFVINVGSAEPHVAVPTDRSHSLSWSPDGRFVAYVSLNAGHARRGTNIAPSSLWVMDMATTAVHRLTEDEHMDLSPRWAPDSRSLYFVSNRAGGEDIFRLTLDSSGRPEQEPVRITTGLSLHSIDLSKDGSQIVAGQLSYRQNIWVSDLSGDLPARFRDAEPITTGEQVIEGISLSQDGAQIAYDSNIRGLAHIFIIPLEGGGALQVTSRSTPDFLYDWSPYSDELAFHTFQDGSRDVGIVSATDCGQTSWSPALSRTFGRFGSGTPIRWRISGTIRIPGTICCS